MVAKDDEGGLASARPGALALRFAGGLLLFGGGLLLFAALGLGALPYDARHGYMLPGGAHAIAAAAVAILGGSGGLLALMGGVVILAGRHAPGVSPSLRRPRLARRGRAVLILLAGLAALLAVLARR